MFARGNLGRLLVSVLVLVATVLLVTACGTASNSTSSASATATPDSRNVVQKSVDTVEGASCSAAQDLPKGFSAKKGDTVPTYTKTYPDGCTGIGWVFTSDLQNGSASVNCTSIGCFQEKTVKTAKK